MSVLTRLSRVCLSQLCLWFVLLPGLCFAVGKDSQKVNGRVEGVPAWKMGAEGIELEVANQHSHTLVEFWIRPDNWLNASGGPKVISELFTEQSHYVLERSQGGSELLLKQGDKVIQRYPTYGWDEAQWMKGMPRARQLHKNVGWHHIGFWLSADRIYLTVDGFPSIQVAEPEHHGKLWKVKLQGDGGMLFAEPEIAGAAAEYDPSALRSRFLTLFMREPQIEHNLMTVPYLREAPVVDGRFSEEEWRGAARIGGWVDVGEGFLTAENHYGYIGYDDTYLYLALVTKNLKQSEDEAFEIYLGPPFVSGERPRRLYRLTGGIDGSQAQSQRLPSINDDWKGVWEWQTSVKGSQHITEFRARFKDLGLPYPDTKDDWSINVFNTVSDIAWFRARWPQVPETMTMRFDREAPVVRIGQWSVDADQIQVSMEILARQNEESLSVGIQLYGDLDILPASSRNETVSLPGGEGLDLDIRIPTEGKQDGHVVIYVKRGDEVLYYQTARYVYKETENH